MSALTIEGLGGKKRLRGTIPVYGAKNSVLPTMAAALLINGETVLENVPDIADVGVMAQIMRTLGAQVTEGSATLRIDARQLTGSVVDRALGKALRASVVLTGPLLARMGSVTFPHPGGDLIGERPIDLFLAGFSALGATVTETEDTYTINARDGLKGGEFFFSTVSVTGTETMLMAAALARGTVVLRNAALEPEVVALAEFLTSCGAKIEGAGTPTIVVTPVSLVEPPPYTIIPDRIEAATFLALGALLGEEITVTNLSVHHLDAVIDVLRRMGVPLTIGTDAISVSAPQVLKPVRVRTHEYPGFATDAHPPVLILLTQANGESVMIESIFDGRLQYTRELNAMGAQITQVSPHRVQVLGPTPLRGATIDTPDIRAGLAFIMAGIVAQGTTVVRRAELVDRGYAHIEERLRAVGVDIRREA